jgi:CelD/BcsL family acetyltransferase involved in cellulose biosynthesis
MAQIERIQTETEFYALEKEWISLLAEIPTAPIFLTWEWISTWWRHFGQDGSLWVLVVRDGAGQILGIAPWMCLRHGVGPFAVRRIAFIGSGIIYPAHLDFLAKPGAEETVCAAILRHLESEHKSWDLLDLKALTQSSRLKSALTARDGSYREREPMACPYIILPGNWESFEKNNLSANMRRNLRYYRRRLEQEYPEQVLFHRVADADDVTPALDALVALHQKRWSQQKRSTALGSSRFVDFHKDLAATLLAQDRLRLYQLKVGEEVIASNYCFRCKQIIYGYQKGFDPDWNKYSPGQLLQAYVIEDAIREGTREFDMLHGEAAKAEWSHEIRTDAHVVFGENRPGLLWMFSTALFDRAKPIGKQMLPQTFQRAVERLLLVRQL